MVWSVALCCLVSGLLLARADPVPLQGLQSDSPHPLTLVSDLTSRLGTRPSRLQDAARLSLPSLPSAQDLEAIRKVAQILVTLGQQVIPAIIGEPVSSGGGGEPGASGGGDVDTPNDPVNIDRQS
ncbi:hypothetical protein PYW07_008176 [Mythimna separata]|uniref:Uncharacterized protein n=1 Tax=Mythimna separata TaxID=271217 RepID=A0AAD7YPR3_MYTSE|nr:hypothetical protein PYW07_008176 [Mythimna separata]